MKRKRVRDAVAAVRDAIGCARRMAKTGDSDAAIEELDKIPEMLGEVLSGDEAVGGADPHHITLNLNGAPAAAARAAPVVDDDEDDAAGGGDDPSASPERLYSEIGRLKMELDWLKKKSGINQ